VNFIRTNDSPNENVKGGFKEDCWRFSNEIHDTSATPDQK
jgi:hypothetical protein